MVQAPPWGVGTPPLGIALISSYLKTKKIEVGIFDANVALYNASDDKTLWNFERKDEWNDRGAFAVIIERLDKQITDCLERIISFDPMMVGISVNQNNILFSLELARRIKQRKNIFIVTGGWGTYNKHERDLLRRDAVVDVFVIGEGEESLHEVIVAYKRGDEIKGVRGVLGKTEEESMFVPRAPKEDLDSIPFPAYEEFSLEDYRSRQLCLLSSRGCIGRCTFCNDRTYQGTFRCRCPEQLVQEFEYHVRRNHVYDFVFNDLLINGNLDHLNRWCDLLIESGLTIRWFAQALTRPDMDLDLLLKMKKSGCHTLQFGVESGSDKILRKMKKMFTVSDAEKVLALTQQAGIAPWVNFIVGYPGEQEEDFQQTLSFIAHNRDKIERVGSVNTCNVVFGSELMKEKEKFGVILSNNPELVEVSWRCADGNCDEVRKDRSRRLIAVLNELRIPVGQTNLFAVPE